MTRQDEIRRVEIRFVDELGAWQLFVPGTDELVDERVFKRLEGADGAGYAANAYLDPEGAAKPRVLSIGGGMIHRDDPRRIMPR